MNSSTNRSNHPTHSSRELFESALDEAIAQSREDIAAGRYVIETPQEHMARLEAMLANEK